MDDAEFRAITKAGRDHDCTSWDEARHLVEHTTIGAMYLLRERMVDLGREVRAALPRPIRRWLEG